MEGKQNAAVPWCKLCLWPPPCSQCALLHFHFCTSGKESSKEGYGDRPFDNWERVMFDCRGQVRWGLWVGSWVGVPVLSSVGQAG